MRGQFRGYRDEPGVARDSAVETFAAVKLTIETWRWAGVPFCMRAGKRLAVDAIEVRVRVQTAAARHLRRAGNRRPSTSASGSAPT